MFGLGQKFVYHIFALTPSNIYFKFKFLFPVNMFRRPFSPNKMRLAVKLIDGLRFLISSSPILLSISASQQGAVSGIPSPSIKRKIQQKQQRDAVVRKSPNPVQAQVQSK